jgi:hypothetical protein
MGRKKELNKSVLQDWVIELSLKKQTVLIETTRAPDILQSEKILQLKRFLRMMILKNADKASDFMNVIPILPKYEELKREFESMSVHSFHHLLMTIEILGYEHPSPNIKSMCNRFYVDGVCSLHHNPETYQQMNERLKDYLEIS